MMYNGFGMDVQSNSTRWMFAQIKKRILPEYPKACECCGQTSGKIGYHAESYAVPFGPHIVAFDVCHLCHVMIHADRRTHYRRIQEYAERLRMGYRFQNYRTFNWKAAKSDFLTNSILPQPIGQGDDHDLTLFTRIVGGAFNPQEGADPFYAPAHKIDLFEKAA